MVLFYIQNTDKIVSDNKQDILHFYFLCQSSNLVSFLMKAMGVLDISGWQFWYHGAGKQVNEIYYDLKDLLNSTKLE